MKTLSIIAGIGLTVAITLGVVIYWFGGQLLH